MYAIHRSCRRLASVTACLLFGLAGCGGSGGGPEPPPGGGEPPPIDDPDPPGEGLTVSVTASDAFGAAVPNAAILLLYSSESGFLETPVRTDTNGHATIDGAPDGTYAVLLAAESLYGSTYEPSQVAEDRVDFDVTLHPSSWLSPGIGRVAITEVSDDARQLTFSARLYIIETYADEQSWYWGSIGVQPCEGCIKGPGGFTAAYSGASLSDELIEPNPVSDPLAIALLLDQSEAVAVSDPADQRLLAAKYLSTRLGAGDAMALAAFAADDVGTGRFALLPSQPVTMFPVEEPVFTSDGRSYFTAIDSLASLEGGGSPMYDALGEMVGFTASTAPPGSRNAVVVVTGSGAGDCGRPAECAAEQDALLEQSASTGIAVVAVELADPAGRFDRKGLGPLAQAENGAVFWAENANQVPTILGRIPEVLDGRHTAIDVTIQLESPVAGAFASGNTVGGTLQVMVCPWECTVLMSFPFGLRVPLR